MNRLTGRRVFPGRALGTARIIRSFADLLVAFPPPLPRPFWAGEDSGDAGEDVICVLLAGHSVTLQDIPRQAVAILSERSLGAEDVGSRMHQCPILDGIGARLRLVRDGDLVLVDADMEQVVVDPTDRVVAAYQAHALGIVPSRRVFVEFAHQPVRLPDGRHIHVSASVREPGLVADAVSEGPDALYVWTECAADAIPAVIQAAHGKPITFAVHPEGCCEGAIARAAAFGDITAMLTIGASTASLATFREAVREASWQLAEAGLDTGRVRYGVHLQEPTSDPTAVLAEGVERVAASTVSSEPGGEWFETLLEAARSVVVPVEWVVQERGFVHAERVLELGVNGVIAPPHEVQLWKESLRNVFAEAEAGELFR